jgi:septum formation inhibitor-activating ATPase MinD
MAELGPRHMQALARALHQVAATHDVVLLDCAAGLAPQSLITVLAASHALVVTNPEIAALTDAYALVKCLVRQGACPDVHLVVNRVVQPGMGKQACERADVCRFVGCDHLGEVQGTRGVVRRLSARCWGIAAGRWWTSHGDARTEGRQPAHSVKPACWRRSPLVDGSNCRSG